MTPSSLPEIAEFVLPGHPDKLCDRIADLLVDAACARDPRALAGVEVALHRGVVYVTGCLTTTPALTRDDVEAAVRLAFADAGYGGPWAPSPAALRIETDLRLEVLDDELRRLRALSDDQAICVGWAGGRGEDRHLPRAHRLAWLAGQALRAGREGYGLGPDGKVIVTVNEGQIVRLSLSVHHLPCVDRGPLWRLAADVARAVGLSDLDRVVVNGGGDFDVGGPFGDNGLSGKKLVVDAYGPGVPIGGGAWSGKDPHKVDRSGGLRARWLALRALRLGLGGEAQVTLGWHPGDRQPSSVHLLVDGAPADPRLLGPIDTSIEGTWRDLRLGRVRFADYADGSWFQRVAPWEGDLRDGAGEAGPVLPDLVTPG